MRSRKQKKYYKGLDLLRVLACLSILFYHLNILKGGYLAVCIFFVLSGYLSCTAVFKSEKFSIVSYYKNRLLKVYLPLFLVVFLTIAIFSFFPKIVWFNLKPETTSVLLGVNNFWQIHANLDYFARAIHSPFLHFWYLGILLQFEFVFPFLFLFLNKVAKKINKITACAIPFSLAIVSFLYFYQMSFHENLIFSYYNTFARSYSLLLGLSLGFIHSYYGNTIKKELKKNSKKISIVYFTILFLTMFFVPASSIYYALSMLVVTLITCRLIEYATIKPTTKKEIAKSKTLAFVSNLSYGIYLIQYPVIFFFQYVNLNAILKIFMIIPFIFLGAYLLQMGLSLKKEQKKKISFLKCFLCIVLFSFSLYGVYKYIKSENYTQEMQELEMQLAENEKKLQEKQEEYENHLKQEEEAWTKLLNDLEAGEEQIESIVANLPVVGVGDSVMLGAVENLYKAFPNGYFDAKVSRSMWKASEILNDLNSRNLINGAVILNLGANGDCSETCKKEIIEKCRDNEVFWLNVTNDEDVHINDKLTRFAAEYENVYIIDWNAISKNHTEYFYADGIHLTPTGRIAYTNAIYESLLEVYLEKFQNQKEQAIKEHEDKEKNKISFYGNNLLLNGFSEIHENFTNAKFNTNTNWNYETLKNELEISSKENTLHHKVVFMFDQNLHLSTSEYKKIIDLCKEHEIYILLPNEQTNFDISKIENVTFLNFYKELQEHSEYVRKDGIHLTEEGNIALSHFLKENLQ